MIIGVEPRQEMRCDIKLCDSRLPVRDSIEAKFKATLGKWKTIKRGKSLYHICPECVQRNRELE